MSIVGAFDVHRRQLTFEYLDTATGELKRGRVMPADRVHLRAWLARFAGVEDVAFAVEGCTGWRYVVLRREALFVRVEVRDLRRRPVAAGR
jgi:transposase